MRNLLILVKMQLKEQLNFTRFEIQNVNLFKVLVSIVAAILKFALVTALCGAFLIVCAVSTGDKAEKSYTKG